MAWKGWDKILIQTNEGLVEGIAPVIISASRAADIPALQAKWFFERLAAGWVRWVNPFNRREQYVSFDKTRVIVFWTKNPRPLLPYLATLDERDLHYYFSFTLNDYEREGLEPGLPPLAERLETFQELSEVIGKARVLWRFDPLILTDTMDVGQLLEKIHDVGERIYRHTEKLIISFIDINNYIRVKRRLGKLGRFREFDSQKMEQLAMGLQDLNHKWGLEIATCAEEYNLTPFQITRNSCVDAKLLVRLFKDDEKLMQFLGNYSMQSDLFGGGSEEWLRPRKDKGQRAACGCIVSKDIGQYNTCLHGCAYCYANS